MTAKQSFLANPEQLEPAAGNAGSFQVIVETPKGNRNKFAFDARQRVFVLRKVLPAGMTFPYDFGFIPQTHAEDGDPIDVLLLMDEPAFPGVAVQARLIGVLEGEQTENGKRLRNDRLLAVAEVNHLYANFRTLDDLPGHTLRELEEFFINYARLEGKEFRLLACKGPQDALHLVERARRAASSAKMDAA